MRIVSVIGVVLAALQTPLWVGVGRGWLATQGAPPPLGGMALAGGATSSVHASRDAPRPARALRAAPAASTAPVDPFASPLCPDAVVTIVSEAEAGAGSRATLRTPTARTARALGFGGSLGSRRVVYVGHNPRLASPAVWLTDGDGLCQAVLRRPPPPAASGQPPGRAPRAPAGAGATAITRLVERVDAESFRIDRKLLLLALDDARELDPALAGVLGRVTSDGFLLARVPGGSLPAVLGLKSGDRLTALDGRPLAGPEGMVRAFTELQRGAPKALTVVRDGRAIELRYTFE